jgi:hypothetical protein
MRPRDRERESQRSGEREQNSGSLRTCDPFV